MNTRSCLLTVGVSALLATGTVLTAAPASAAPGSAECVAAQSALKTQLGVASVDINLANQLRDGLAAFDALFAQLDPLVFEAELTLEEEWAALELAWTAEADADARVAAATIALEQANAAEPVDSDAVAAAELELTDALAEQEKAIDAVAVAETALQTATDAAFGTPEIIALEQQIEAVSVSLEDAFTRLGLTEGTDPEQLIALADAAVAACSAPAVQTPVVRAAAPQQQRGLNIQTAAHDAGATDPANLALLAGLAGFGAAAATGTVVVVRRRGAGQA